ncbi:SDR family NAD(P)-dependent oxidoreductase [Actinomadura rubrisoli]|uniref:Probable oxidoreductase n=1 Tax=Actinomadura rubrisoli TaxID=2530368 RepID=A0A4R5AIU0_9ACTN|nr:SDR family NAD(P)-dependent oxidoreductase [Actinomadura rubrisoli]TDD71420.1 SDR family NAD(P)-dependent oxidoreductase [Actinomadura rubrisoli]
MTYDASSTAMDVIGGHNLTGKETIVTGGASGLGLETARAFAEAGARVVLAGRDSAKGEEAAARLREDTGNGRVVFRPLDLGSLESVRRWVHAHAATGRPLHILVANAGIMATPLTRTAEGFESQFGVNHLGHFALTLGLLPSLRAAGGARVVSLSSRAHRRGDVDLDDPNYLYRPYDPWEAYGQSKTATALFAVGMTAHFAGDGITCNAVMPGAIMTGLQRHIPRRELAETGWSAEERPPGWKTPEQGAATSVWAAVAPELDGVSGKYLDDCAIAGPWTGTGDPPNGHYLRHALDPERAERLWDLSELLVDEGR